VLISSCPPTNNSVSSNMGGAPETRHADNKQSRTTITERITCGNAPGLNGSSSATPSLRPALAIHDDDRILVHVGYSEHEFIPSIRALSVCEPSVSGEISLTWLAVTPRGSRRRTSTFSMVEAFES